MNKLSDEDRERLRMITCGNESAARFLIIWGELSERLDDIVDETTDAEFKIKTAQLFNLLYSQSFYREHVQALYLLVSLINNAYADAELCVISVQPWKIALGDVLRHASADMVRAVALICGEYDHLRSISMELHERCYLLHHDEEGKPE